MRRRVLEPLANDLQVRPQSVERARISHRDAHLSHLYVELVQAFEIRRKLLSRPILIDPRVDLAQLPVEPVQADVDEEVHDRGNRLRHRVKNPEDRDEEEKEARGEDPEPEWKMPLEKASARFVEGLGFRRERDVHGLGRGELAGWMKHAAGGMDLIGRLKQEKLDRRMQI